MEIQPLLDLAMFFAICIIRFAVILAAVDLLVAAYCTVTDTDAPGLGRRLRFYAGLIINFVRCSLAFTLLYGIFTV